MNKFIYVVITAAALAVCYLSFMAGQVTALQEIQAVVKTETVPTKSVNPEFTTEDMDGVYLITDNLTGCQYIKPYNGNALPRMYSDGIQVCGQHTYPNGEHELNANGLPTDVPISVE